MTMNELFATNEQTSTNSARQLPATAQLTEIASHVAGDVIKLIIEDADKYHDAFEASKVDHGAMDKLISELYDLKTVDTRFLEDVSDDAIDGMLKSQQSKRSRSKSKVMTADNYKTLMVGAVSENLIRIATGQEKSAGSRRMSGTVEFTEEELEAFKNDQELLKKELRNVQSKKSIAKSKADFDETDERYQAILRAEEQLKEIRTPSQADGTRNSLKELLDGVEIHKLKAEDAKNLLDEIAKLIV